MECCGQWTIGTDGERGSWGSVLAARHEDDDGVDFVYKKDILQRK